MINFSNRLAFLTARLNLAFRLGKVAEDQERERARQEIGKIVHPSGDAIVSGPFAPYIEEAEKTYLDQRAELAWENKVKETLSLFGMSIHSVSHALGREAGDTVKLHNEGLTTYREAIYFLAQKIFVRSEDELHIPR